MRWPVDVRFIELMPMSDKSAFGPEAYIPCSSVVEGIPELMPLPESDGVARLYRLPKGQGRIGLISPLSADFCGRCNRLRLTAEGRVKPCLGYDAAYDVTPFLNDEKKLEEVIKSIIKAFRSFQ